MSEESRNPEREISEAELTNVSGGCRCLDHTSCEADILHFLCSSCPKSKRKSCKGSAAQVVKYLQKHARAIIHGPRECPFYQG